MLQNISGSWWKGGSDWWFETNDISASFNWGRNIKDSAWLTVIALPLRVSFVRFGNELLAKRYEFYKCVGRSALISAPEGQLIFRISLSIWDEKQVKEEGGDMSRRTILVCNEVVIPQMWRYDMLYLSIGTRVHEKRDQNLKLVYIKWLITFAWSQRRKHASHLSNWVWFSMAWKTRWRIVTTPWCEDGLDWRDVELLDHIPVVTESLVGVSKVS